MELKQSRKNSCAINNNNRYYIPCVTFIILLIFIATDVNARSIRNKHYLHLGQSKSSDISDLSVTSIGVLALEKNMVGRADLTRLKSDTNESAYTLDFGGGYAFNWDASFYLSLNASFGYNSDKDEKIAAYFPEAGIVLDITKHFGITASARRYHRLYDEEETFVRFGLVFRN